MKIKSPYTFDTQQRRELLTNLPNWNDENHQNKKMARQNVDKSSHSLHWICWKHVSRRCQLTIKCHYYDLEKWMSLHQHSFLSIHITMFEKYISKPSYTPSHRIVTKQQRGALKQPNLCDTPVHMLVVTSEFCPHSLFGLLSVTCVHSWQTMRHSIHMLAVQSVFKKKKKNPPCQFFAFFLWILSSIIGWKKLICSCFFNSFWNTANRLQKPGLI